jgi:hypothetical protein
VLLSINALPLSIRLISGISKLFPSFFGEETVLSKSFAVIESYDLLKSKELLKPGRLTFPLFFFMTALISSVISPSSDGSCGL